MQSNPTIGVAQRLLERADETQSGITPMKLNLLTYICHGWLLANYGKPLSIEPVVARRFGPCLPELTDLTGAGELPPPNFVQAQIDDSRNAEIADEVYDGYSGFTDMELFQMTRDRGTPWRVVWGEDNSGNAVIEDDLIMDHYISLVGH